jgi:uncharacterized membrane protein (DUF485 family)
MKDLALLAVIVGVFVLTALYVRWADHLVGPDAGGEEDR